jgi:hypothetical protein
VQIGNRPIPYVLDEADVLPEVLVVAAVAVEENVERALL